MISTIIEGISKVTGKVTDTIQQKNKLKYEVQKESFSYLKLKMTTTIFGVVAIISVLPYLFYMLSPLLKYLPFMPEVLNDYEKIINNVGFDRIYNIIVGLLGLGGIASVGTVAGKVSMAKRANDNATAIKKEQIKKNIVGDDFVTLTANDKSLSYVKKFVKEYGKYAIEVEKKYGLPASGVLAHAALESGWGKSILTGYDENKNKIQTNNIFNIKKSSNWTGPIAFRKVWEVKDDKDTTESATFKVYSTIQDAFDDYAKLLTTLERYKKVNDADDPEEYADALYECGYMTDKKAPEKIKKIIAKNFIYET